MSAIDMQDPAVQRLIGRPPERELMHLAGDPDTGLQSTLDLGLAGGKIEVLVRYKDFVLTVDVYRMPGEPIQVHLICPRCRHQLRVTGDRKRIELDQMRGDPAEGGELNIEPFTCTWELPDAGEHTPGRQLVGSTLCKWRVGIEKNIARDA